MIEPAVLRWLFVLGCAPALAGCAQEMPQALGTLEYDRITVPAPAAEPIVAIEVREGERVEAGQRLLRLEPERTRSTAVAGVAEADRQRALLTELHSGPRSERIAQARAELTAAQARAREAQAYLARLQQLQARQLVAAADLDRARAAAGLATAQVLGARAALAELEHGTRDEQIAQGEAAVRAAEAQSAVQQETLNRLDVVAPRAGRVESLPFKLGDQAPVGAPLVILLVGEAPYARIYVPEPQRVGVRVGSRVRVHVDGRDEALPGSVRMIRSEPSFTPYYALTGDDAARLSYLAEVELGPAAADLPAGLPVRVELDAETGTAGAD